MSESRELSREAGRELDAEIAMRVFGAHGLLRVRQSWPPASDDYMPAFNMGIGGEPLLHAGALTLEREKHFTTDDGGRLTGGIGMYFAKPFSTDIAAAFSVVEAANEKHGWQYHMRQGISGWVVEVIDPYAPVPTMLAEIDVEAQSLPHAICLATLRAVEEQRETGGGR